MRRLLTSVVVLLALSLVGPAVAQEGTPAASDSLLAGMGYPELLVEGDGETIQVPEQVPAGRTLITLANAGEESWHGFVLRRPEGVTDEQIVADLGPESEAPPAWLFDATFPGFPGETLPGKSHQAVVDLTPGQYLVIGDTYQPFEVVGAPATPETTPGAAPAADGTVRMFDFNFEFPDPVAPGRQVWEVTNTGEQPHELLLARSPQPVTAEQIMELMAGESEEATPTGGGPSFADLEQVGGLGWLSPGATAWTEVDLSPGTYVALCFVPDPETMMPHVAMGMIAVFTIDDAGVATPAASTPAA